MGSRELEQAGTSLTLSGCTGAPPALSALLGGWISYTEAGAGRRDRLEALMPSLNNSNPDSCLGCSRRAGRISPARCHGCS